MPRSTRTVKSKSAAPRVTESAPVVERTEVKETRVEHSSMRQEHKTFSHIMYFLFLISVTMAAFFSFRAFQEVATSPNFLPMLSIMMLVWSFLFWEFGHRIHQ